MCNDPRDAKLYNARITFRRPQGANKALCDLAPMRAVLVATRDHEGRVPDHSVPIGGRGRYPYLDRSCVEQVWCYFLGNALIFGAMIAKLWRVTKLLVNPAMRDIRVPLPVFLRYVGALVLLHVALLTAWTVNAPPYYRTEVFDRDGLHIWHGSCDLLPAGATPYPIALLSIELALIQFGIYLCNRSRNVNPRYSEGKSIAFILWEFLQMTSIGLVVGALVYPFGENGHPITFFVVRWLAPVSVNITVTAFMFVGKVVEWWTGKNKMPNIPVPSVSRISPRHHASLHTKAIHGSDDAVAEELGLPKSMSGCVAVSAKRKGVHHAEGTNKGSSEASLRSSGQSHKTSSPIGAQHEQGLVKSLISQLQEAREAHLLAEERLLDASNDLTELRERNMELRERSDMMARELKQAREAAARN